MPAISDSVAQSYVAAAYIVFLALLLIYIAIMAAKLARLERELQALDELTQREPPPVASSTTPAGSERA